MPDTQLANSSVLCGSNTTIATGTGRSPSETLAAWYNPASPALFAAKPVPAPPAPTGDAIYRPSQSALVKYSDLLVGAISPQPVRSVDEVCYYASENTEMPKAEIDARLEVCRLEAVNGALLKMVGEMQAAEGKRLVAEALTRMPVTDPPAKGGIPLRALRGMDQRIGLFVPRT